MAIAVWPLETVTLLDFVAPLTGLQLTEYVPALSCTLIVAPDPFEAPFTENAQLPPTATATSVPIASPEGGVAVAVGAAVAVAFGEGMTGPDGCVDEGDVGLGMIGVEGCEGCWPPATAVGWAGAAGSEGVLGGGVPAACFGGSGGVAAPPVSVGAAAPVGGGTAMAVSVEAAVGVSEPPPEKKTMMPTRSVRPMSPPATAMRTVFRLFFGGHATSLAPDIAVELAFVPGVPGAPGRGPPAPAAPIAAPAAPAAPPRSLHDGCACRLGPSSWSGGPSSEGCPGGTDACFGIPVAAPPNIGLCWPCCEALAGGAPAEGRCIPGGPGDGAT